MPNGCAGELCLRSTAARMGLDHSLAGFVDPGFHGTLTVELKNNKQNGSIILHRSQRLFQLVVHRLTLPTLNPYGERGHYQGQSGPTAPYTIL